VKGSENKMPLSNESTIVLSIFSATGLDGRTHRKRIRGHRLAGQKQNSGMGGEYNEWMDCQVKDKLVSQLISLNNKLNLLSPDLVQGDQERAEVQQQRENLYAEIKHHRAKGHAGKPCPAARKV
jgi:hypothetical protein